MSSRTKLNRRDFLRASAMTAVGLLAASCARPTPVVVEKQVPVEKVVKETVVVEKQVPVEKVVKETVVVEKKVEVEKVVVPTKYKEAPMLAELVKAGKLPPVEQRLPENPVVVPVVESIGKYGGTWRMVTRTTPHYHVYEFLQYEPLLRFSPGGLDILPNVAEKWEASADAKVYTYHLRKGIKWSDGAPFTAEDCAFYFNDYASNKELQPTFPTWLRAGTQVPKFEKLDDYTIRFTYTVSNPFLARLSGRPFNEAFLPKHYLQQFHASYAKKEDLDKLVKEKNFDTWSKLFLNEANRDTSVGMPVLFAWDLETQGPQGNTYVRNPYYWKVDPEGNQLPYIDKAVTNMVANLAAAQMETFSGNSDLTVFAAGQFPADTMILKKNEQMGNYHVIDGPISEPNVFVFGFNLNHKDPVLKKIFNDKRFRIALSHAINREEIRQLIYLGVPEEVRQCVPLRRSPFYHEKAAKSYIEFDLKKAAAMLDEMGLDKKDANGIRLRPDGQPLAFTMEVYSQRDDFIDALEMISEWWKQIGINASVKPQDPSLYNTRRQAGEHDAGVDYAGGGLFPLLNASDYIPINNGAVQAPLWGLWYASNGEKGEEPPAEVKKQLELFNKALATPNEAEQKELWAQIMDIHAENMYHYGICDRAPVPIPCSNRFRNVPTSGFDLDWDAGNIGTTNPCQYWIAE